MEHWHYFWKFYQDTGKRKWGSPYLTWEFFKEIHKTMRNDILLVLAFNKGEAIAGALNFVGSKTLFGRYWGATQYHKFLHYELCYYQAIDYAINNGLEKVEAGAQGDHKISRGYLPHKTHSLHWFLHNGMHEAIQNYLVGEKESIEFDTGYIKKHKINDFWKKLKSINKSLIIKKNSFYILKSKEKIIRKIFKKNMELNLAI